MASGIGNVDFVQFLPRWLGGVNPWGYEYCFIPYSLLVARMSKNHDNTFVYSLDNSVFRVAGAGSKSFGE